MKRLQIPHKLVYEKFYLHQKILRTRNCLRKFIKNLLSEKHKENMQTKQPRFKSRLNKTEKLDKENSNFCYRVGNVESPENQISTNQVFLSNFLSLSLSLSLCRLLFSNFFLQILLCYGL